MPSEQIRTDMQGASLVAVGRFNPAIFHPIWFSTNELIRKEEADEAEIQVIHKDISVVSFKWFSLQVLTDRFIINTTDASMFYPLRDLVMGTFAILEHTPVKAFGFNHYVHVDMSSEENWHAFGNHYAPKQSWERIIENPGMRSLTIEGKRKGEEEGRIQVKIGPSLKIPYGISIDINEHYDIPEEKRELPAEAMAFFHDRLRNEWDGYLEYSEEVTRHLLEAYKG